jgi:hypothetical protein
MKSGRKFRKPECFFSNATEEFFAILRAMKNLLSHKTPDANIPRPEAPTATMVTLLMGGR